MVRKTYSYIRTYLGDVVVRETKMGFDVKGEEGAEAADATGSGGVPVTASTYTIATKAVGGPPSNCQ